MKKLNIPLLKHFFSFYTLISISSLLFITLNINTANAQSENFVQKVDEKLYGALEWRSVGPHRGGRSCAVTGIANNPNTYYMGTTGGGIWKTIDAGSTWQNISDGYFGGSIGCVEVSKSNTNVIYVGGGEQTVRGNVSFGYGVWKSEDGGKTWQQKGLPNSRHIARIRVNPKNENIAFAAVMGDLFKSSADRGVYKTTDGGNTWKKVLFANTDAGAVDIVFDPFNANILYASTWRVRRTPYSFSSGGEGSGIWKSTDGGETWINISENNGLPKGTLGIICLSASPVQQDRLWAMVENENGGVFLSDDGGKNWKKVNSERKLRQRAWYFSRIYADTQDPEAVYVLNVRFHKSTDGGKSFESIRTPHADHHDLWIAPEDPKRMIVANDGGGQVSFDGGSNWSTYMNQPTAQFYRITTDNHFPYRIYVAQQDNSTLRILHRTTDGNINEQHWESTAGGESAHIAVDRTNNEVVFGGSYDGYLTRYDHRTDQVRAVNVWPDNPMGHGAENMKYRFNWNFPIFFSPHNSKRLYTTSNHLHVSENGGESWEIISPDLTRNDTAKLGPSGGPITKDNTSVEYYCTIFAAAESPIKEGLIWTGSDDGLVHVTKDGGKNWQNVTPKSLPEWTMINNIEIDPFNEGGCYIIGTRYKLGDYTPYIYKTEDYGSTWRKITGGINPEHFTRALKADPKRKGLLYAGTESGMYISFNDGKNWQPFQLNLPTVPITDLALKNNNLIAATQGRSIWIIDDLTVLHQISEQLVQNKFHLFKPMDSYRMGGWGGNKSRTAGTNHPNGVMVYYYLSDKVDTTKNITLTFYNETGDTIKTYSNNSKEKDKKFKVKKGSNLFNWNTYYEGAEGFDGMVLWWASMAGPKAVPGKYSLSLQIGEEVQTQEFSILKDPRTAASQQDFEEQFNFLMEVRDKVSETHQTIKQIKTLREQLNNFTSNIKDDSVYKHIVEKANNIDSLITNIETTLYQTKSKSRQDPINFPIKLNNKLAHLNSLMRYGDYPPTKQAVAVKEELTALIDEQISQFNTIINTEVTTLNNMIYESKVPIIQLKEK